ncbi:MAG: hypothetical protein HQ582_17155 [Planctomycetes bacterium]|nr:hypothetical protein [Planctomycetota bacterium]
MTLQLWYDRTFVGRIDGAFEHQGTWFGDFHAGELHASETQNQRLRDFINFCQDWYAREGSPGGADATQFDAFDDLVRSRRWYTIDETGMKATITDAPLFMDGCNGDVSWIVQT